MKCLVAENLQNSPLSASLSSLGFEIIFADVNFAITNAVDVVCLSEKGSFCEVKAVKKFNPRTFLLIYDELAANKAREREWLFDNGVNMVSYDLEAIDVILQHLISVENESLNIVDSYSCSLCNYKNLSQNNLWEHTQYFHSNDKNACVPCNICGILDQSYQVHMFEFHGPPGHHVTPQERAPLYAFSLVVCQRKVKDENGNIINKFLAVQESGYRGFWLPGGKVDPGEHLIDAAIRETKEEAGVDVELTGILRLSYHSMPKYTRLRAIFLAKPIDESSNFAKTIPDFESSGAVWVTVDELEEIRLRGSEPRFWFNKVNDGACEIHSMSLLGCDESNKLRL